MAVPSPSPSQGLSSLVERSHDLRSPLTAIIGMSRMLLTRRLGPLTDKQTDYLNDIAGAGERLLGLLEELLGRAPARTSSTNGEIRPVRSLRVLVVDDDPANQRLLTELLGQWSHTVLVAGSGAEALAKLEVETVDLVLLDVQMPQMDGYTLARTLRARKTGKRLPLVGLTAATSVADRDQCRKAGMDGHVSKPLDLHELFETIERLVAENEPFFDERMALGKAGGDCAFLEGMVELFLSGVGERVQRIEQALQEGDRIRVGREAHTLKGHAGQFSGRVGQLGGEVEKLASTGSCAELEKAWLTLRSALDQLGAELSAWSPRRGLQEDGSSRAGKGRGLAGDGSSTA